MNILIIGQFSNNRGDEAAGRAMIYGIKKVLPEAKITVYYLNKSLAPVLDNKQIVTNLFKNDKGAGSFCALVLLHFLFDKLNCKFLMFHEESMQFLKLIKNSELILLSPGGPYIGDLYDIRSEAIRLIALFVAQRYKKKTMIYGPSMGPFKKYNLRYFLRKLILNKVDAITVRDNISYKYLRELHLKAKEIHCTLDAAIQRELPAEKADYFYEKLNLNPKSEFLIGVTPIDMSWHPKWGRQRDIKQINKRIINELSIGLNKISQDLNCKFVFFPQLFGAQEDLTVIRTVINNLTNSNNAVVLPVEFDSDIQQIMISKLRMFIGMRYHSIVFSAKMNIPFLGIVYEHKTEGFISHIGMKDYMFMLGTFDGEQIYHGTMNVLKNHDKIKAFLSNINKDITNESVNNNRILYNTLCKT